MLARLVRCGVVILVLVGLVWVIHAPLLRWAAGRLVHEDAVAENPAMFLVLRGTEYGPEGDGAFDLVAEARQRDPNLGVVVLDPPPSRLVELGITAAFGEMAERELKKRGIPAEAITIVATPSNDRARQLTALVAWAHQAPAKQTTLLCERLGSRKWAEVREGLSEADAALVDLWSVADRRFDEDRWWTSRRGLRTVVRCWLELWGERNERVQSPGPRPAWNADGYQRKLAAEYGKAGE